jgi:hypothetical protein
MRELGMTTLSCILNECKDQALEEGRILLLFEEHFFGWVMMCGLNLGGNKMWFGGGMHLIINLGGVFK